MADGRDAARARPPGRPARRVPGAARRRQGRRRQADLDDHPGHRREPRQRDRRRRADRQTQGNDRVVVELPGVTDPEAIRQPHRHDRPARLRPARPSTQATEGQELDLDAVPRRCSAATRSRRRRVGTDQNGRPAVDFKLQGRRRRAVRATTPRRTSASYFAIVLDGTVVSAPVIRQPITDGNGQITGGLAGFNAEDARTWSRCSSTARCRSRSQELSSFSTISATLGASSSTRPSWPASSASRLVFAVHAHLLPTARRGRLLRADLLHARRARHLPARSR